MRDVIVRGVDGRTDEQWYAIISPYFDGRIKMNGPYPEITNISFLAKLFFKTFISLKHFSDYRPVGLSDCQTIGLSDYSYGPKSNALQKSTKHTNIGLFSLCKYLFNRVFKINI